MPPDLMLGSTLISWYYPSLEHIFMVPNVFEPLKFYYTTTKVAFIKLLYFILLKYILLYINFDCISFFFLFFLFFCILFACVCVFYSTKGTYFSHFNMQHQSKHKAIILEKHCIFCFIFYSSATLYLYSRFKTVYHQTASIVQVHT